MRRSGSINEPQKTGFEIERGSNDQELPRYLINSNYSTVQREADASR